MLYFLPRLLHVALNVSCISKIVCLQIFTWWQWRSIWLSLIHPGHASLSFAGNSYIKYRVAENSRRHELKLGLHLRTLQSNGIIMYAEGEYCVILKVSVMVWILNVVLNYIFEFVFQYLIPLEFKIDSSWIPLKFELRYT